MAYFIDGREVRRLRKGLPETLTQTEISRRTKINQTTLSDIERGRIIGTRDTAKKLARVLGCKIGDIWREYEPTLTGEGGLLPDRQQEAQFIDETADYHAAVELLSALIRAGTIKIEAMEDPECTLANAIKIAREAARMIDPKEGD